MPDTPIVKPVEDQDERDHAVLQSALAVLLLRHGPITFTVDEVSPVRDMAFAVGHSHEGGTCTITVMLAETPGAPSDEAPVQ
jgi:hypothetical protein